MSAKITASEQMKTSPVPRRGPERMYSYARARNLRPSACVGALPYERVRFADVQTNFNVGYMHGYRATRGHAHCRVRLFNDPRLPRTMPCRRPINRLFYVHTRLFVRYRSRVHRPLIRFVLQRVSGVFTTLRDTFSSANVIR